MFVVVAYDIRDAQRLRQMAVLCEGQGVRVQNSVFEMTINTAEYILLVKQIKQIINSKEDSVRLYKIGKRYPNKIDVLGVNAKLELGKDQLLLF